MLRAEETAVRAGRTLLTSKTTAGDHAEALYRRMGWVELGRIPGYARRADGSDEEMLFFSRLAK